MKTFNNYYSTHQTQKGKKRACRIMYNQIEHNLLSEANILMIKTVLHICGSPSLASVMYFHCYVVVLCY